MKLYEIQPSAIITWSYITWYCIHHFSCWGKIYIWVLIHKRHHIPHLNGRGMGSLLCGFWRTLTEIQQCHQNAIKPNAFEYVTWKMEAILIRLQCVKSRATYITCFRHAVRIIKASYSAQLVIVCTLHMQLGCIAYKSPTHRYQFTPGLREAWLNWVVQGYNRKVTPADSTYLLTWQYMSPATAPS